MTSVEKFNGLNGTIVSRTELENIQSQAEREEQEHVAKRINKVLNANAKITTFEIDLTETAYELEKRLEKIAKNIPADQYEEGEAIRSTDENAVAKLKQKLAQVEAEKEKTVRLNKAVKEWEKTNDFKVFAKHNIDDETANEIIENIKRTGFPLITGVPHINAEIRRIKKRIEALEKQESKGVSDMEFEGGKIVFDGKNHRIKIFFDDIPEKETREAIKKQGFKWSPKDKVWQRIYNSNGEYSVKLLFAKKILKKVETEPQKNDLAGLNATASHPDTINFNKQILKAKKEGLNSMQLIKLGRAKGYLKNFIGNKQMRITGSVVKKSMTKDTDHAMTFDKYLNLPDKINNPIAIFKSETVTGDFVVLIEVFNENTGIPFIVALDFNPKSTVVNITSIYSKISNGVYRDWIKKEYLQHIKPDLASLDNKEWNAILDLENLDFDTLKYKKRCQTQASSGLIPECGSASRGKHTTKKTNHQTKPQKNDLAGLNATASHPDTINFNKQILKAKKEGVSLRLEYNLGKPKNILADYTDARRNITILGSVIKKAMTKDDSHIMRWEDFINLPDYINNPLAIFRSKTNKKAKVILTEIINYKKKPIIIAVSFNDTYKITEIKSLYSRKNDSTYKNWEKEGLLLYKNEKSDLLDRVFLGTIPSASNKSHDKHTTKKRNYQTKSLNLSTEKFKNMSVRELRAYTLKYYNENLKGKKATIKKHLKEIVFTNVAGKKIAKGEAMYSAKAVAVEHLEDLIINSTYNNWGNRKESDVKEVLGYFNFKSKLIIDGEKRHVRISLTVYDNRKTELKNIEVGKKKVLISTQEPVAYLQDEEKRVLLEDKSKVKKRYNQTKPKKNNTKGLKAVVVEPQEPEETKPTTNKNRHSLAYQYANNQVNEDNYIIDNEDISQFIGTLEKKPIDSLVITISGKQGSGKTRFAFQFINALAQRYSVAHASIEEHPASRLYIEKTMQYFNDTTLENTEAHDVRSLAQLHEIIERNDVIVIDSFQKMKEIDRKFEIDKDLRKNYNGKLFLVVYQQTTTGAMRGGSKSQYDGDIILHTASSEDYKENYVYADKNRYNPEIGLKYNIYYQVLAQEEIETDITEV